MLGALPQKSLAQSPSILHRILSSELSAISARAFFASISQGFRAKGEGGEEEEKRSARTIENSHTATTTHFVSRTKGK
jgi:thiamine kinase-like enzyme